MAIVYKSLTITLQDCQNSKYSKKVREMPTPIFLRATTKSKATPIHLVDKVELKRRIAKDRRLAACVASHQYEANPLTLLLVNGPDGGLQAVYCGQSKADADPFAVGAICSKLPPGHFAFASKLADPELTALAWCLEQYKYALRQTSQPQRIATLEPPRGVNAAEILNLVDATTLARDLVNTPANLLGPQELEDAVRRVAKQFSAKLQVTTGEKLKRNFPLIHIVGAASASPPRLIDFTWGSNRHPKVTLVGKGVSFDTGGLDIKPSSSMLLMKKDMGGAANVLGLAQLIMRAKLPVRLRVLIPAVENAISAEAFRPGDVFTTRKGLTVEIGNTDAEGRLILADALALADEEKPDLLIDMATLTGAARVALGPDIPPFFTDSAVLAETLMKHADKENDPLWRLPLWKPYHALFESPVADINNAGSGGFAGSITAALFLKRFVEKAVHYIHFDIFAWVPAAKPGRPKGGEAQGMRALFSLIRERYKKS